MLQLFASTYKTEQEFSHLISKSLIVVYPTWFRVLMWCNLQIDLLLGKAYSGWGHITDALAVYDQLIASHPVDFRGYLAKVHFYSTFFPNWHA